ncbi:MAG: hypothetical protein CMN98_07290 [Synechococcus sp. NP17]|jgi:hypothetical protein|nr:hypothetical protein [Synechococcus sp. NP17]
MTRLLCRCFSLLILTAGVSPAFAFEPLQKSFNATPVEESIDVSAEQVHFSSADLKRSETTSASPAAPGEKGRAPKGYSLLDLGF